MVINKKRLVFILIFMLVLCFFLMYKDNQYAQSKLDKTVQTNGTPVSDRTVILDAGHGSPDRSELSLVMAFQKRILILQLC